MMAEAAAQTIVGGRIRMLLLILLIFNDQINVTDSSTA